MSTETEFLSPDEMTPEDWAVYNETGLPPRRSESATGLNSQLAAAGWPVEGIDDPAEVAKAAAESERLEAMSPSDHLKEIQEDGWQLQKR